MRVHVLAIFYLALPLGTIFSDPAIASLAIQCEQSFFRVQPMDRMSLAVMNIIHVATKEGGAFSDRDESKFTVSTDLMEKRVETLSQTYGSSWRERDKAEFNRQNVTETDYVAKMRYRNLIGDERRVKIRFREYLTTDSEDINLIRTSNTSGNRDKVWMEIKIQHPADQRKVIKARSLVYKSDRRYLVDDLYLTYRDQFLDRMTELNLNGTQPLMTREKFDSIVRFLDAVYNSPRKRTGLYAKTKYRRRSYAVYIPVKGLEKPIEVQFTLDDRIQLTRLQDGQRFETYFPDETVVEVKVPSHFSGFTPQDLALANGLVHIKESLQWLESQHAARLPMHKGKLSKVRPMQSKEIDKETESNNDSFLEDLF